jgi:choline dehydrogenase-like flavoprotein
MSGEADTYDFIVTGAGSAGCVIAARLSESGRHRVLLLEAGPPDRNPWIHIPLGFAKTYVNPRVNWRFESAPQPQLAGRKLYLPRGKTLGGSSSINGMVYMRGHHGDYDEWRQRGCEGWDWDSVLPFFRKAENQTRGADEFHGVGGPLHVSDQPGRFELADAALEACVQAHATPTSTARNRKAAATTRQPAATGAAGAPRRPIWSPPASAPTSSSTPAPTPPAC